MAKALKATRKKRGAPFGSHAELDRPSHWSLAPTTKSPMRWTVRLHVPINRPRSRSLSNYRGSSNGRVCARSFDVP